IRLRSGRPISGFGEDSAFELPGVLSVNYAIDCCRHQDIARHREEFVWIDRIILGERPQRPFLKNVLFGGLNIYSFRIVDRRVRVATPSNVDPAVLRGEQTGRWPTVGG